MQHNQIPSPVYPTLECLKLLLRGGRVAPDPVLDVDGPHDDGGVVGNVAAEGLARAGAGGAVRWAEVCRWLEAGSD
jgi:hypothetical protein